MHLGMAIVLGLGLCMAGSVTAAGSGNLRYSISVSKFENKAGWSGQWDIGNAFGEIMTAALQESGKFIVLGEKDTGEVLDTEMKQAGKIKVTSVKEKISYCEVLNGSIKPDMTIQPAN